MRFLLVDRLVAEDLIAERTFQSTEFEQGNALALFLTRKLNTVKLGPRIAIHMRAAGCYLLPYRGQSNDLIIFDLEAAPVFSEKPSAEALLIFQRVLRFAIRHWKNLKFSISERFIPNSSKAVIFPFPITSQSFFRVTIERSPDAKRRDKRPNQGQILLVYKCGIDEGGGPQEKASLTVFRKAISELEMARQSVQSGQLATAGGSQAKITSIGVTMLDSVSAAPLTAHLGFDNWQRYLTEAQRAFVDAELHTPHRIEGPAGTGKTLSLVLKCIRMLREAEKNGEEHRSLFIAHSEATRRTIQELFDTNDSASYSQHDRLMQLQSVKVTTLHQLCGELLNTEISETEFLDRDAFESKLAQLLYTNEALEEVMARDFDTHKPFLSKEFLSYLQEEDSWVVSQMLQHEISVVIKGRAEEDLGKYKKIPKLRYGLPIHSESDKGFVFLMFQAYQRRLQDAAQFDTDDVVLSASGQLNTPIWRRRREREGYDSIFIDETHLFNLNELSVFHRLTRRDTSFPIAYSADRSQALGDRGWSNELFDEVMTPSELGRGQINRTVIRAIFRCSPEIVNLAFSVTSAGATLFTNFEDPLKLASSAFTEQEERKCAPPTYYEFPNDELMVKETFVHAERMAQELEMQKADVAIVGFNDDLFAALQKYARDGNKPVEVLKQRGDTEVVKRAHQSGRFILASPDFIGGLEFAGVVLVGVDGGRVPPKPGHDTVDSSNFLSYASHGRLYVAITRARFRVEILGTRERGPSPLLKSAIDSGLLACVG